MSSVVASPEPSRHNLVSDLLDLLEPRAKSLIVTVYGDAILPYGGEAWLGDLIGLMRPFGVTERLVRTSVFRLTQDGVLTARQVGRRSIYALTEAGHGEFGAAQRRIYAPPPAEVKQRQPTWQIILLLDDITPAAREILRRELSWAGFGCFGAQALIGVGADMERAHQIISGHGLGNAVCAFDASPRSGAEMLGALCKDAWPLHETDREYRTYMENFAPLGAALSNAADIPDAEAFALRILTIHAFRRTLLKDPGLPPDLMHEDWSGPAARDLTARIYRHLAAPAQRHVVQHLSGTSGPLSTINDSFHHRFNSAMAA